MRQNDRKHRDRFKIWLLSKILPNRDRDSLIGDFLEIHARYLNNHQWLSAKIYLWSQILKSLPLFFLNSCLWSIIMFKNYLKIAFRNIRRHRGYAFINITGLALGITCCIVILLYIITELSYDKYHEHKECIYRVSQLEETENHTSIDPNTAPPLVPALIDDFPEVESGARILPISSRLVKQENRIFYEDLFMFADEALFEILTIPILEGNPETFLDRPNTMVISQRMAEKYFGPESPLGQSIDVDSRKYEITGVVSNPPKNTHLKYDLIAAFKFEEEQDIFANWMWHTVYSYIKLAPDVDVEVFEAKMSKIGDRYAKDMFDRMGYSYTFFLQPVPDLHLYPCPHYELEPPGNPQRLVIFSSVGVLVLLIACMNFMNLTTARSANRAKEIGMRKVIGAQRVQVIRQFFGESLFISTLAFILALLLVILMLPFINELTGMTFTTHDFTGHGLPFILGGLLILVGIGSGCYPALLLSKFRPVTTLKGQSGITRGSRFREVLVVSQFTMTIVLLISTLVVIRQLNFMKHWDLGFSKEQKLILPVRGNVSIQENYESIKAEFLTYHNISEASASSSVPGQDLGQIFTQLIGEDDEKKQSMHCLFFDQDFISHFNIKLIVGRDFHQDDTNGSFIINESAVKSFGWESPEQALGKRIGTGMEREGTIVGVCKNFHYRGLQTTIGPLVVDMFPRMFRRINLTVSTENLEETLAFVERKWETLFPGSPFEFSFLDDYFNRQYRAEEQVSRMMIVFTFLGIFIASLGLFGLASFMAEQRTKEIGIRKVLGASVSGIAFLLSKEFSKWVLIANVLAWPAAYFAIQQWLQNFAYRTNLGLDIFILSGVLALAIALVTVSQLVIRAARVNPVRLLKYE